MINRLIKELNLSIVGFRTSRHFCNEEFIGFTLEDVNSQITKATDKPYIAKLLKNGPPVPVPETFETFGVKILQSSLQSKDGIILMDELGFFEAKAPLFQQSVFACLDSAQPVFGVIKPRSNNFLDKIRRRNDINIFPITIKNRDKQYRLIKELFYESYHISSTPAGDPVSSLIEG